MMYSVLLFVKDESYEEDLESTIGAIQQQMGEDIYEIFLVSHMDLAPWRDIRIFSVKEAMEEISGKYVLFLSAETFLAGDSLARMRWLLEDDGRIGAAGPFLNRSYIDAQTCFPGKAYKSIRELQEMIGAWQGRDSAENKRVMHLDDHCLLVRREALLGAGMPDGRIPGLWAADFSLRLLLAGYRLRICGTAYAHCDRQAFSEEERQLGREAFHEKWGFHCGYSMNIRDSLLGTVDVRRKGIHVLDLGCACGGTLMWLREVNPSAELYGIEFNSTAAWVAKTWGQVLNVDLETWDDFGWREKFDIIIMGDILEHLRETDTVLKKVNAWLKPNGQVVLSVPNVMHISVLHDLLRLGRWHYQEEGILDRTHLRFFTRKEIVGYVQEAGFEIQDMMHSQVKLCDAWQDVLDALRESVMRDGWEDCLAVQWVLVLGKGQ